jgi:hypothetical protein
MLLLSRITRTNLRRITGPQVVSQPRGHLYKPLAVPGRLHPDERMLRQVPIKPLGLSRSMFQPLLPGLSRRGLQLTNLLPAGVVIASYNPH